MEAHPRRHRNFSPAVPHLPKLFRQNPVLPGLVYVGKMITATLQNQLIFAAAISAEPPGGEGVPEIRALALRTKCTFSKAQFLALREEI